MPTGPVTHGKAWVEMVHRYLATGVGVLILTLAVATWLLRGARAAGQHPWWPAAHAGLGLPAGRLRCAHGDDEAVPRHRHLHLLGGLVLLALLCMQAVPTARRSGARPGAIPSRRALGWSRPSCCCGCRSRSAAGSAPTTRCWPAAVPDLPGQLVAGDGLPQGFELWRHLGLTGAGEHITFAALTAIHYVHRLVAYVVFAVLGRAGLALRARPAAARRRAGIAGWRCGNFATGLSNVVLGWPLVAAVAHTGGAAALVVALTWALRESRAGRGPVTMQPVAAPRARVNAARREAM
jgi:cytochrome c oxidase assembly protein subunit 15